MNRIIKHPTTKSAKRSEEEGCVYGLKRLACYKIRSFLLLQVFGIGDNGGEMDFKANL